MFRFRRTFGAVSVVGLVVLGAPVAPAQADHVNCGDVVTQSLVLDRHLGPCPGDGLIVQGSRITIDLNGHTIFGTRVTHGSGPTAKQTAGGQFAGVRLVGTTGVSVANGTVKYFAAGVVIEGGSGNKVTSLTAEDNYGPPETTELGDGIALFGSRDNMVNGNVVRRNGPFSGIALVRASSGNTVHNNDLWENNLFDICGSGPESLACGQPGEPVWAEDMGVRIEGPGATKNTVSNNRIGRSGVMGIFITSSCENFGLTTMLGDPCQGAQNADNVVKGNTVTETGVRGDGPGPRAGGIQTFTVGNAIPPVRNVIESNDVKDNLRDGIWIGLRSTGNTIRNNTAANNNKLGLSSTYDARDNHLDNPDTSANEACDSNTWLNNKFGTVNQPCVAARTGNRGGDHSAQLDIRGPRDNKPGTARAR